MEIQDDVWREILQATGAIAIDRERLNMRLGGLLKDFAAASQEIGWLKAEQEKLKGLLASKPTHTIVLDTPEVPTHEALPDPGQ